MRQLPAPAGDERRERDQRHGLGEDDVRQQAALDDPEPLHEHRQQQPDDRAGHEADRGDCASVNRHASSTTSQTGPAAGELRVGRSRRSTSPTCGIDGVVGARQHPDAEDHGAVGVADRLVALPDSAASTTAPSAPTTSRPRRRHAALMRRPSRDDLLAVGLQGRLLGVVLEVDARTGRRRAPAARRSRSRWASTGPRMQNRSTTSSGHERRCACCRPGRARRSRSPGGPRCSR